MADPLVGKVLADRFEILDRIGEGGTGVVYKAKQIAVDRDIAIKVLGAHVSSDPTWVKRFQNEAKAAAKLHSPHTVQLIDFGQTKEGLLFIAMELLQGRSLRDELDKSGKMVPQRALRIVMQACESLSEAHAQSIIHRDIKPDNLYLDTSKGSGDFVKVLDFSVAKMDNADSQQTRAGIVFGTPAYMSPEQGRGAKLGPQSDIYALGIVLYEMLTGKPPFDSRIPTEVVMMHLRDKPAPLAGLPDPLNALVMRTLAKGPAERYASCEELSAACEEVLAELYPQTTPSGMRAYRTGPVPLQGGGRPVTGPQVAQSGQGGGGARPQQGGQGIQSNVPSSQGGRQGGAQSNVPAAMGGRAQMGGAAAAQGNWGAPPPAAEQRTMIADAPNLQRPPAQGQGHAGRPAGGGGPSAQATMALNNAWNAPNPQGTMILPDSQGIIFAAQQAELVRQEAAREHAAATQAAVKPAHWSFWVAWVVLGLGGGLAIHFAMAHQAIAAHAG